jgi:hypothetical protein
VTRPISNPSPVASSYTSTNRPPTNGSIRSPRARSRSFQYQLSRLHQRLMPPVYSAKAAAGSTGTSTDWLTVGSIYSSSMVVLGGS